MATEVERTRKFTADEWKRMVELGIFREDERLELIDGEIVEMARIGHDHGLAVANLNELLVLELRRRALVWGNGPARVAIDSVPQPDLAVLRRRSYRTRAPRPDDVLLIIEVADSSLR
jgi:Uma2 family endonuclease